MSTAAEPRAERRHRHAVGRQVDAVGAGRERHVERGR